MYVLWSVQRIKKKEKNVDCMVTLHKLQESEEMVLTCQSLLFHGNSYSRIPSSARAHRLKCVGCFELQHKREKLGMQYGHLSAENDLP